MDYLFVKALHRKVATVSQLKEQLDEAKKQVRYAQDKENELNTFLEQAEKDLLDVLATKP